MKEKTLKNVEREIAKSWEGWRPLLKTKLEELDFMARRMNAEMSAIRIPTSLAMEYTQKEFIALWEEVTEQENQMYGANGIRLTNGGKGK